MFLFKRDYEYLRDRADALKQQIKDERKIYDDKIEELIKEKNKYKDEISDVRCKIRQIKRIITAEKQVQSYGSVENTLNRIYASIEKIEEGE